MAKIELKQVIDETLQEAIEKAAFNLTKKYRGQELVVKMGLIYPERELVRNEIVKVNYFKVIANDGSFDNCIQFKPRIYVTILVDDQERQIWVDELKTK
jgi:hypothetical protein